MKNLKRTVLPLLESTKVDSAAGLQSSLTPDQESPERYLEIFFGHHDH
ncbi:MAG: hypothetical protein P1P86_11810 [Bacteroidales bacterium]|nr:hypothetical protein [Bacteroidales bacterium]